ncbi:MAG: Gfo/Idh/MocA family oxidoreductase [Vicinamibacteria bacterium]|nr:Gfo/Idh/MocA family oxidoreductase [Vicinamibacteria bacterium]
MLNALETRGANHTRAAQTAPEPLLLFVGLGSIGRRHLHNIESLGHSRVILYRSGFGAALPDASHRQVEHDLSLALMYRPVVVIVSNPTALHMPVALAAARQGCHLFIEQPLSDSLYGVEYLMREVQKRDNVVLIGYQCRFHPILRRIKATTAPSANRSRSTCTGASTFQTGITWETVATTTAPGAISAAACC